MPSPGSAGTGAQGLPFCIPTSLSVGDGVSPRGSRWSRLIPALEAAVCLHPKGWKEACSGDKVRRGHRMPRWDPALSEISAHTKPPLFRARIKRTTIKCQQPLDGCGMCILFLPEEIVSIFRCGFTIVAVPGCLGRRRGVLKPLAFMTQPRHSPARGSETPT